MKNMLAAAVFAVAFTVGAPAVAGEVTGNGDQIDSPGASICKFSGQNDGNLPAGRTQSFGQNVREGRLDPRDFDPDYDGPFGPLASRYPGFACNPNNFDARTIPL